MSCTVALSRLNRVASKSHAKKNDCCVSCNSDQPQCESPLFRQDLWAKEVGGEVSDEAVEEAGQWVDQAECQSVQSPGPMHAASSFISKISSIGSRSFIHGPRRQGHRRYMEADYI